MLLFIFGKEGNYLNHITYLIKKLPYINIKRSIDIDMEV